MNTVWITTGVAILFLVLAAVRIARNGGRIEPAPRVWLLTGGIFSAVSLYLWLTLPA